MARTLEELAALSGVSRATVSRVLNGGPVAETTRQRVLSAMADSGYRPNMAARTLATGRSGVVGVVVHVTGKLAFSDPYFSGLLEGMSEVLADESVGMMLWLGNRSKEETLDQILSRGLLDGVIVTANMADDPLVDGLLASNFPTVLIGHRRADRTASYVDVDHVAAADAITTHLVESAGAASATSGAPPATWPPRIARPGYRRALVRVGLDPIGLVVDGDFNFPSGAVAAETLLDLGVDAIFCANDATAEGALHTIRGRGLDVPGDVALAGFDDLEFAARLDPPLTTVRQQVTEQGREAANTLFRLLQDPEGGPRRVILPTELVIRQSTAREVAVA